MTAYRKIMTISGLDLSDLPKTGSTRFFAGIQYERKRICRLLKKHRAMPFLLNNSPFCAICFGALYPIHTYHGIRYMHELGKKNQTKARK